MKQAIQEQRIYNELMSNPTQPGVQWCEPCCRKLEQRGYQVSWVSYSPDSNPCACGNSGRVYPVYRPQPPFGLLR